jgi:hypothetical protein
LIDDKTLTDKKKKKRRKKRGKGINMTGSTLLKKVQFQPGFNKNTTDYSAENYWVEGDKVRFRNGRPEKIGGWVGETVEQANDDSVSTFTGTARDIHAWIDLDFLKYLVVGTHKKVELFYGNQIFNITPYREELTLTDAITTTSGETEVEIEDANPHNLSVGDYVNITDQASAVDGITLDGEYTVTEIVSTTVFKIDSGTSATGSTSGGGGDLDINYYLENGDESNGNLIGYGGGTYGTEGESGGGYDEIRDGVGGSYLRQWSFDNWGEDCVACVREGKLYHWDATNGVETNLQVITNAPEENLIVLVAQPSRFLCAFGSEVESTGTFDPLTIRWASQETLTTWTSTTENTAGEYRLPLGNYIVSVIQTKGEILIFTDSTVYSMRYIGGSDVFQFDILGNNVTSTSQHAGVDVNGIVYWMGTDSFYYYDGVVHNLPCSIEEDIFDQDGDNRLNFNQKEKTFCSTNKEFGEILWLYPSEASDEIDRYIIYNYKENLWYDGTLDRTVWLDRIIFSKPYSISSSGNLYIHEQGKDDDGSSMTAYLKSGDIDLEDGSNLMFIDRFIPDFKLVPNRNASLYLYLKKYLTDEATEKGPYSFNNETNKISLRAKARHVSIKYQVDALGADFEVGSPRFGLQPDSRR